jgi:hypothetical protein
MYIGVFAGERMEAGTFLGIYAGELITEAIGESRRYVFTELYLVPSLATGGAQAIQ